MSRNKYLVISTSLVPIGISGPDPKLVVPFPSSVLSAEDKVLHSYTYTDLYWQKSQ